MRWCAVGESHDKIFLRSQTIPLVITFNFSNVVLVLEKEIIAFHENGDGMVTRWWRDGDRMETLDAQNVNKRILIQFRVVCIFLTLADQKLYKRPLAIVNSSCCLKLFVDNNIPRIVPIHGNKELFLSKLSFIFLLLFFLSLFSLEYLTKLTDEAYIA